MTIKEGDWVIDNVPVGQFRSADRLVEVLMQTPWALLVRGLAQFAGLSLTRTSFLMLAHDHPAPPSFCCLAALPTHLSLSCSRSLQQLCDPSYDQGAPAQFGNGVDYDTGIPPQGGDVPYEENPYGDNGEPYNPYGETGDPGDYEPQNDVEL